MLTATCSFEDVCNHEAIDPPAIYNIDWLLYAYAVIDSFLSDAKVLHHQDVNDCIHNHALHSGSRCDAKWAYMVNVEYTLFALDDKEGFVVKENRDGSKSRLDVKSVGSSAWWCRSHLRKRSQHVMFCQGDPLQPICTNRGDPLQPIYKSGRLTLADTGEASSTRKGVGDPLQHTHASYTPALLVGVALHHKLRGERMLTNLANCAAVPHCVGNLLELT